jgi:Tol biopolymer transport system component
MLKPNRSRRLDFRRRPPKWLQAGARRRLRLPISIIVLALIVGLFFLIPPLGPAPDAARSLTKRATVFPFPSTFTPFPTPTPEHGGRIVFTCTRGDYMQLCTINADGTGLRRLTDHKAHDYYPIFMPQGDALLYASNQTGSFDIYLLLLNSSKLYQLTGGIGNAFSPDPSPDGKTILFANRPAAGPAALWLMETTGKNPRILYSGTGAIVGAAWSPDGKSVAFVMDTGAENYQVFLLDPLAPERAPRQLTSDLTGLTGSLDWSPDGKYLLLCAGPSGDKDIFRLEISTGAVVQLTDGGNNAAASYSPDGLWIAFNSLRNDNQADLFIMRADGTYQRQLTDDPEPDWQPQWEP